MLVMILDVQRRFRSCRLRSRFPEVVRHRSDRVQDGKRDHGSFRLWFRVT